MNRQITLMAMILLLLAGCTTTTPTAAPVIPPTETGAVPPTATLPTTAPTLEPPAPTPLPPAAAPGASEAYLSPAGQLAFIDAGILYVEAAPGSGNPVEIGRYTLHAAWSPDGARLLYDASPQPPTEASGIADFRIYEAATGVSYSLVEQIAGFPPPPYLSANWAAAGEPLPAVFQTTWLPPGPPAGIAAWAADSQGIYWINPVESERLPVSYPGANTVLFADLAASQSRLVAEAVLVSRVIPGTAGTFIVQDHCGELCEWLTGYDRNGSQTWHLPWVTSGNFAVSAGREFLVNAGRIAFDQPTDNNTIDQIDIAAGTVTTIWTLDPGQYFVPSTAYKTLLSTDDRLAAFNYFEGEQLYLQVIDRVGGSYGRLSDAVPVAWQPGGGLVYLQAVREAPPQGVRLMYWDPAANLTLEISGVTQASPVDAAWSPNGSAFAYCVYDPAAGRQALYTWNPQANAAPLAIHEFVAAEAANCNPVWLPGSSALFFNAPSGSGTRALWQASPPAPPIQISGN